MKKLILILPLLIILSSLVSAVCNDTLYNYTFAGSDDQGFCWRPDNSPRRFSGAKFIVNGTGPKNITSIVMVIEDNTPASTGEIIFEIWNGTENEGGFATAEPLNIISNNTPNITGAELPAQNVKRNYTFNFFDGLIVNNDDVLFAIGNGTALDAAAEICPVGLNAGADEVAGVYKYIDVVMEYQKDLVDKVAKFDPKIVKMSGD